jgi:putative transposase
MPRKIVPLVTDELYHIFNRGTDKRDIFIDKSDYLRFYQTLNYFNTIEPVINFDYAKVAHKNSKVKTKLVDIKAYALLPNHYHLILQQVTDGGISEFIKRISGGFTSYFNQKYDRTGVLFQGKFKRVFIERDEQFQYLLAYVNENQFVHGIEFKREICHSSSLHYQGLAKSALISEVVSHYNFKEGVKLATDIYTKRQLLKTEALFE